MKGKMAEEALADVLAQIDTGLLGATAAERAYIAGSLYTLRQLDDEAN
ncbi:hypothetical protein [Kocuria sabuli]